MQITAGDIVDGVKVRQFAFQTARVVGTPENPVKVVDYTFDQDDENFLLEQTLARAVGSRVDNHTTYEVTIGGRIWFLQFSDFKVYSGPSIESF